MSRETFYDLLLHRIPKKTWISFLAKSFTKDALMKEGAEEYFLFSV
jgi:hypothetical protein